MATQAPADGDRVGAPAVPGGVSSSGDDDGAGAASLHHRDLLADLPNAVAAAAQHSHNKNMQKRMEKIRQQPHVIMINQSGVPTVVSSGGHGGMGGHVQHVSVVGHVHHVTGPYEGGVGVPGGEADELPSKKKATSFKITNVYLSRPPSNDGDDSCDDNEDLEDSHTEDLSDIADSLSSQLETVAAVAALNSGLAPGPGDSVHHLHRAATNGPPAGPGTWGKAVLGQQSSNDDPEFQFRKPSNAIGLRRQSTEKEWDSGLPSYPHPGFGFVTFHQSGNTFHPVSYLDKAVSGAVAVYNSMECGGELGLATSSQQGAVTVGPQDFKTKFKVVKVETTEPLKRGRWTCIDFTDKQHTTPASSSEPSKQAASAGGPVSGTAAQSGASSANASKPATKTSEMAATSRPGSTLPRETPESAASVINSDSAAPPGPGHAQTAEPSFHLHSKSDQELAEAGGLAAAEEKEPEVVSPPKAEVRATSTGPESAKPSPGAAPSSAAPSYPAAASYPSPVSTAASSSSAAPSLAMQQSVITPTPAPAPSTVQSPHAVQPGGGAGAGQPALPQQPDFNTLQNTIGQVIRLTDGTLAQVALAPLPQQQQMVKIIPNSTNQQMVHQQQVMVNAQGQQFLVSQQQQNINQVPQPQQQQSNRSQIQSQPQTQLQQQQQPPPQITAGQQQPSNRSQQQPQQQQQSQSVMRSQPSAGPVQQQPVTTVAGVQQPQQQHPIPANQGVISAPLPMQPQPPPPQQMSAVAGGAAPQQPQQVSSAVASSAQQQQQAPAATPASAGVSTQQQQAKVTASQHQHHNSAAAAQSVVVVSAPAPAKRPSASGGGVVVTSVRAASSSSQPSSHNNGGTVTVSSPQVPAPHPYAAPAPASLFLGPGLDTGYGGSVVSSVVGSMMDSDGLVERLEDLVSTQFGEEARDGELGELESASGAGQGSIDHRIEQAMDLVKSHLMTAVRSEVEELREKISKLEDTVGHLSRENEVLRANVQPEVLASLLGSRSILGSLPPEPGLAPHPHPALQPPSQH